MSEIPNKPKKADAKIDSFCEKIDLKVKLYCDGATNKQRRILICALKSADFKQVGNTSSWVFTSSKKGKKQQ